MRYVLVFAFLLFTFASALAAEPQQETAAMLQQDLSRACPHGYGVVNGKCAPPCDKGMMRSLSGKCVSISGANNSSSPNCGPNEKAEGDHCIIIASDSQQPGDCPQGQERVGDACKSACLAKQERDEDGICVTKCPQGKPRLHGHCQGEQGLHLN